MLLSCDEKECVMVLEAKRSRLQNPLTTQAGTSRLPALEDDTVEVVFGPHDASVTERKGSWNIIPVVQDFCRF